MEANRGASVLAWMLFDWDGKRSQVAVNPAVVQLAFFVPAPAALSGHAKAGVSHQYHQAPSAAQCPGGRLGIARRRAPGDTDDSPLLSRAQTERLGLARRTQAALPPG